MLTAQPSLIGKGEPRCQDIEPQIAIVTVAHKAAQGLVVVVGRAVPSCLMEQADLLAEEIENGGLAADYDLLTIMLLP